MVDLSALTSQETDDANARIGASAPVASGETPGFGAAFAASWDENKYYQSVFSTYNAQRDFIQQRLDAYHDSYGERLDNPMTALGLPSVATSQEQADGFANIRQRFAARGVQFPTDDEIAQGGLDLSRKALRTSADVAQSGGPTATLGSLTGGLVAGATDPVNAAATAAASAAVGPEAGIVLKALAMGGAFGASQGAEDIASLREKRAINPAFGLGDVASDVAASAVGGAAMELGGAAVSKLIGAGWRRLVGRSPEVAASLPLPVKDAGTVAERAADLDAQNPFKGASGEAAHNEAIAAVEAQTIAGETPAVPASAAEEAATRGGEVFTEGPTREPAEPAVTAPQEPVSAPAAATPAPAFQVPDKVTISVLGKSYEVPTDLNGNMEAARRAGVSVDRFFDATQDEVERLRNAAPTPPPTPARDAQAFYGSGQSVSVRYRVVEARDLVTSHGDDFHANPAYPAELQPRNRGGKPAMEQVHEIAGNLQPERLGPSVEANSGAPIVGPDNVVESGNGRAMAIRMAHARGNAGPYRAFLERSGFDTSRFKEPVLIARRVTPMSSARREAFAHAANGRASLGMSPVEQAMSDARHISPDVAALAKGGDVASLANRDFARAFMAKLSQGERSSMQKPDGGLSQAGVFRLRAAMTARAYGDAGVVARLFNHPNVDIKTIGHGLEAATSEWIKMRDAATAGVIPPTQDITGDLMTAVKSIMRAKDEGRPVGEIMQQGDMFTSDMSGLAARLFFKDGEGFSKLRSKADMASNLTAFARDLRTGAEAGTDLLGNAPRSAEQVLRDTLTAADRRTAALTSAARSSEAIAKSLADPALDESMFADLERNIEQGNNKYAKEDGSIGVADPELAGAKSDESLAKEIGACAMPAPEEAAE